MMHTPEVQDEAILLPPGEPGGVPDPSLSAARSALYGRSPRARRSWWRVVAALAILSVGLGAIRSAGAWSSAGGAFVIRIESQQPATIDLRSALDPHPDAFGVNVFPETATRAADGALGFMSYDFNTVDELQTMGVTLLRFPGGTWGEEHTASPQQVDAFLALAHQTHADPLMQVRLSGSTPEQAAALVRFCNALVKSATATGVAAPRGPVRYWSIGNEPDLRGPNYTVADYVHDFIAFAAAMKAADPTIQILGPELSQYNGPAAPPRDSQGVPWLEGFLQGVARYEQLHHVTLLDGVSIHRYALGANIESSALLFASVDEWRYALPALRDQIHQTLGRDVPVAVTEVNTGPQGSSVGTPATALWWADVLGTLREQDVPFVAFFAARGISQPQSLLAVDGSPTPLSRAMEMYTHMAPDVVPVEAAGPVRLYAATNAARNILTVLLVNETAVPVTARVDPTHRFSGWQSPQLRVPANAIMCAVLRRNGKDKAFVYAPETQGLAPGEAGVVTAEQVR